MRELRKKAGAERAARGEHQHLADARLALGPGDRLFVLEPRAHAGVGYGAGDCGRGQLRGVVLHVQPLADHVHGERLEADEVLEAPLEHRNFFAAVHALDLEGRLGVQLADGTGGGHLFFTGAGAPQRELTLTPCLGFTCPRLGVAAGAFHWRWGHPQRELTLTPCLGFTCPRLGVAAAPFPSRWGPPPPAPPPPLAPRRRPP